jgi:hypothetical protein
MLHGFVGYAHAPFQYSNLPGDFGVCFFLGFKSSCKISSSPEFSDSGDE